MADIDNILYKLSVILDYEDSDQVNQQYRIGQARFSTRTETEKAQTRGLRAVLHHAYRALKTHGGTITQERIDIAWVMLIVTSAGYCQIAQMNGIEAFTSALGIEPQLQYFKPDSHGHEADRFWGPLSEFKTKMADDALLAILPPASQNVHVYSRMRILLNNLVGLPILMADYGEDKPLDQIYKDRLLQDFAMRFNFETICAHMLAVFNESPETRARLRTIPQLTKMFFGNIDFKRYVFDGETPSDQAILEGDTPITEKEMMLYIKIFIGRDGAFDEEELAVRDSGMAQI